MGPPAVFTATHFPVKLIGIGIGIALDEADADELQDIGEGHANGAEVGVVVAHPDGVPGIAVDDGDAHLVGTDAPPVELARRADGAPQPGEADDDDGNAASGSVGECQWR